MSASYPDIELSKYWSLLSPDQKKSLLEVIISFTQSSETAGLELQDAGPEYDSSNSVFIKIISGLSYEQKDALIYLLQSFRIEEPGQRISIEQYNKELDEAEAEFERGEVISHEEIKAMTKKWVHGE